jgi:hypothetical protein
LIVGGHRMRKRDYFAGIYKIPPSKLRQNLINCEEDNCDPLPPRRAPPMLSRLIDSSARVFLAIACPPRDPKVRRSKDLQPTRRAPEN